jgi:DNA-binding response OmpR family regulator
MAKILLVEDDDANSDMLSRRLVRKGFDVVVAFDGRDGIDAAGRERPDVILMDLDLPEIDGWEATRLLKSNKMTNHIPVIAFTAHAMSDDREKALEAGCDDYDTKPLNLARLLAKIETSLKRGANS